MPFPLEIAVASLVMAIGCSFQAAFGIGMALFVVPALALIDTRFVPGPILFAGIALAAATAYRDRAAINYAILNLSLVGLGIGTAVGFLTKLNFVGFAFGVYVGLVLLAIREARARGDAQFL